METRGFVNGNKRLKDARGRQVKNFDTFWALYPNKKGKGAARKAYEKVMSGNDEAALFKDMELALEAQKRYRQEAKSSGEFIAPWKHPSTWLNQECWLDEIGSHADLKQKTELAQCSMAGCECEVHGPRFDHCVRHLNFGADGKFRIRTGLSENGNKTFVGQLVAEMRDYYAKHGEMDHQEAMRFMKGLRG